MPNSNEKHYKASRINWFPTCISATGHISHIYRIVKSVAIMSKINSTMSRKCKVNLHLKFHVVVSKTFTENWVGKQSFFVLILTTA